MSIPGQRLCSSCNSPLVRLEDALAEVWVCSRRGDAVNPCRYVFMGSASEGVCCPRCHCRDLLKDSTVTNTYDRSTHIRRRRVCRNCGKVIYTRETLEAAAS